MPEYVTGIERPTERDFQASERTLKDYTDTVTSSDWVFSSMNGEDIEEILHSANTVLKYHHQHLGPSESQTGTRAKRRGEIDSRDSSGGRCIP